MNKTLLLFIITILSSCQFHSSNDKNIQIPNLDSIEKIVIDPDKVGKEISVSDLFENISYIPLETSDSLLVGRVHDFEVFNNNYYILDKSNTASVFIFDEHGKNRSYFNKHGGGPGEYLDPFDLSIDQSKERVLLWCDKKHIVFSYDFNGNFINSHKINTYGDVVNILSSGNYVSYLNYRQNLQFIKEKQWPNLIIVDKKGEIISSSAYFPKISKKNFWNTGRDFSNLNNDTISIIPDHSNFVYYIANDNIIPRLYIDFGEHNLDEAYWTKIVGMKPEIEFVSVLSQDYCLIREYKETPEYIYLKYLYKDKNINALYSKKSRKLVQFNKLLGCIKPYLSIESFVGNKFYVLLEPYLLKRTRTDDLSDEIILNPLLERISEDDNPVVMEMTLKDF